MEQVCGNSHLAFEMSLEDVGEEGEEEEEDEER